MSPKELAEKIEQLIVSAGEALSGRLVAIQNRLYNQLVNILKSLDTDPDGYILQSAGNRKILNDAVFKIDESFAADTPYTASIDEYVKSIPKVNELNNLYFETISKSFSANKNFVKSLQRQTIETLENTLLNDGLQAQIKTPLINILNRNVNSGGSFTGFLQEVQNYVKGTSDLDGRLLSYSKGITKDALSIYARTYQQAFTSDLGLKWFVYSGGLMDKSRDFCIERAGNYYHESEIKKWASQEWAGKMRGTTESSIFTYCGGYQCTHQLIPVHDSMVPSEDLERNNALQE